MADASHTMGAELKRGYYLLNTDGGNGGDPLGMAAIGVVLRKPSLAPLDALSEPIGPATHNAAEYRALIEGLKLALSHGIERIRVYMDSELVVEQMNGRSAVKNPHLAKLHHHAQQLAVEFKSIRFSWVPREMNADADRLASLALKAA